MKTNGKGKPGDFFKIPLYEKKMSFGRVLESQDWAFYDGLYDRVPPLEEIAAQNVIFRVWVASRAVGPRKWEVVGNLPLEEPLKVPAKFCKQDPITKALWIYDPKDPKPATYEECRDLEKAAVWSATHVEDRLRDHFAGRPNVWRESLRVKPPH